MLKKTFFSIIYIASGVFLYDFDRGYADSEVITLKKKFYNIRPRAGKACLEQTL
jgi:hypothetical protein